MMEALSRLECIVWASHCYAKQESTVSDTCFPISWQGTNIRNLTYPLFTGTRCDTGRGVGKSGPMGCPVICYARPAQARS